ncbi:MAG TPA: 3'(2'),5'-bisphosphate nucleotidase CysQ [Pyrinomonadaceae bacterium]
MSEQTDTMSAGLAGPLARELGAAIRLARAAGAAALTHYGGPLDIVHKSENEDPVTQADHAANDVIMGGLAAEFPADGLLSEESVDTVRRLGRARVWIIDPLDGTRGFISGNGDFAVQIGLAVGGAAALGVVYLPASDVLYFAAQGHGAWVVRRETEAARVRVSTQTDLPRMRLAVSRTHRSPKMDAVVRAFGFKDEVARGSVGIKIGLIVEQQCDLYIHLSPRTKQWDTCAPEAILTAAGGRLTDLWGEPYRYNTEDVQNRNGLLATNGAAHPAVVARLAPLLAEFGRKRM